MLNKIILILVIKVVLGSPVTLPLEIMCEGKGVLPLVPPPNKVVKVIWVKNPRMAAVELWKMNNPSPPLGPWHPKYDAELFELNTETLEMREMEIPDIVFEQYTW